MTLLTNHRQKKLEPGTHLFLAPEDETGLNFEIHQMRAGECLSPGREGFETAALVVSGKGIIATGQNELVFERPDWISHAPAVVHLPSGKEARIIAESPCKIAVLRTENPCSFAEKIYSPGDVQVEHRGKGLLEETCYRQVRLVFDKTIAPPESRLVLGEVLNYPGRWSSYPPHHHPQPEIYYYEFSPDVGYGHGELGTEVYQIRHQDLLKITGNRDHSQVAAPGYHLYYLWAIRHLEELPYHGFEFTSPHDRLLS